MKIITLNKLIINVHNIKKQIYIKTHVNNLTFNTFMLIKFNKLIKNF